MLTPEDRDDIRSRYAQGGVTYAQLAEDYGVTAPSIGKIIRGEQREQEIIRREYVAGRLKDAYRGSWRILLDGDEFVDTLVSAALNGQKDPEAPEDRVTYTFASGRVIALGRIMAVSPA